MKEKTKFSIIMPVYNVEEYIGQAIESIINQVYSNWELVIINDGSTDKSGELCDFYKKFDSRIKVYHQENRGVSFSRNKALKLVNGDYICFVDSDDWVESDWLITIKNLIEENNDVDLFVNSWREEYDDHSVIIELDDIKMNNEEFKNYYIERYITNSFPGFCCNKIYKKSIIDNLEFDQELDIIEDEVFNYSIYIRLNNIMILNKCMYNYRKFNRETLTTKSQYKYQKNMINRAKKINLIKENLFNIWDIKDERYIACIDKQYIFSMYDCILNICLHCNDSKERKKNLNKIINDVNLKEKLKTYNINNNKAIWLIMFLVSNVRNSTIIYVIVKLILKVSNIRNNF